MFLRFVPALIVLAMFASHSLAMPAIYNVILDGTSSVSEEDFRKANEAIQGFAKLLNVRSQANIGERADMLSVNYFGGPKEYTGTRFINCSDADGLNSLDSEIGSKEHPKYGSTAIYSAIAYASVEVVEEDSKLPGQYMMSIILITDGDDNDSPDDIKEAIQKNFPNPKVNLFVITVGASVDVKLANAADKVIPIDDFGALGAALVLTTQVLK